MRILLLFGGRSAEHEVSRVSAAFVGDVLEQCGHEVFRVPIGLSGDWTLDGRPLRIETCTPRWRIVSTDGELDFDVVFPVLHGPFGEDGTVQGLCMMAGWPFAGCDVMASSLAMNKVSTKEIAATRGIPVLPWESFRIGDRPDAESVAHLGFPLFVKPARMGSSVGVSRVDTGKDLEEAVRLAFSYDSLIVIEKGLPGAREIEVAVLSNRGDVRTSVPGEIVPGLQWYDYTAKYRDAGSRLVIPAPLGEEETGLVRDYAAMSFSMLFGSGFARCDFLMSAEGELYFNEINTIPGFTEISMFPKLWKATGMEPGEVMETILREAVERHELLSSNLTIVPDDDCRE